ncbi:hypothetical protein RchiOBHm_Chr2g0140791 [Rosa chinensis]|uniref:Uncharacterized protein n=1 Tax=Rosa chinensis TaxID=74649 RepID=A0A2P6RXF0_ROSCH|nr:hypothetical protein RchiOBHm_Chr2g0140791 [Rosa chinensis]
MLQPGAEPRSRLYGLKPRQHFGPKIPKYIYLPLAHNSPKKKKKILICNLPHLLDLSASPSRLLDAQRRSSHQVDEMQPVLLFMILS